LHSTLYCLQIQDQDHDSFSCPQTFLLPFDPEDHEDADEWRLWTGDLSAKELYKVCLRISSGFTQGCVFLD
jgi:hypothetical protein